MTITGKVAAWALDKVAPRLNRLRVGAMQHVRRADTRARKLLEKAEAAAVERVDWSSYRDYLDVPKHLRRHIPEDTFNDWYGEVVEKQRREMAGLRFRARSPIHDHPGAALVLDVDGPRIETGWT